MSQPIIPVFRWSGAFVGFLVDGCLFDPVGLYLGWEAQAGRLFKRDGSFWGERVETHYVLRRTAFAAPIPRPPRVPPVIPDLPPAPPDRIPRAPRPGWSDALEAVGLRPQTEDLYGGWRNPFETLYLHADGSYRQQPDGGVVPVQGTWELRGNLILRPAQSPDTDPAPGALVFRVIEYDIDSLSLRRITQTERSLPLTLHRMAPAPT